MLSLPLGQAHFTGVAKVFRVKSAFRCLDVAILKSSKTILWTLEFTGRGQCIRVCEKLVERRANQIVPLVTEHSKPRRQRIAALRLNEAPVDSRIHLVSNVGVANLLM